MKALRHLSADASLDATSRNLAAERAIEHYLEHGTNLRERCSMLLALDSEIATVVEAGEFWPTVRDIIAQLLNQLPDQG